MGGDHTRMVNDFLVEEDLGAGSGALGASLFNEHFQFLEAGDVAGGRLLLFAN